MACVRLRAFADEDAETLCAFTREPDARRAMPEMTLSDVAHAHFLIERVRHFSAELPPEETAHLFAVARISDGALVGVCGLAPRVPFGVELGYLIGREYRRRGYGLEAARLGLAYAREKKVGRVHALVQPDNEASRALLDKLGFFFAGGARCLVDERMQTLLHYYYDVRDSDAQDCGAEGVKRGG